MPGNRSCLPCPRHPSSGETRCCSGRPGPHFETGLSYWELTWLGGHAHCRSSGLHPVSFVTSGVSLLIVPCPCSHYVPLLSFAVALFSFKIKYFEILGTNVGNTQMNEGGPSFCSLSSGRRGRWIIAHTVRCSRNGRLGLC